LSSDVTKKENEVVFEHGVRAYWSSGSQRLCHSKIGFTTRYYSI
jgi:hypothetical protein